MSRNKRSVKTPSYRLHRPTGKAVVTIDSKDHYLGPYDSAESHQLYERLIGEWMLRGRVGPSAANGGGTMAQVVAGYLEHVKSERPLRAVEVMAMRWVVRMYGDLSAKDFGAVQFKAMRLKMATTKVAYRPRGRACKLDRTLSREYINTLAKRIRAMVSWATAVGMMPAGNCYLIREVKDWQRGRSPARETPVVGPVDEAFIDKVAECCNPKLAAMIRIQHLCAMRSGELLSMRTCDIDTRPDVWRYKPEHHKTENAGCDRVILIGPQAQELLRPFFKPNLRDYLFKPAEIGTWGVRIYKAKDGAIRVVHFRYHTRHSPRDTYTASAYATHIRRKCALADKLAHIRNPSAAAEVTLVQKWHSHQLRHSRAQFLADTFGLLVAKDVLGHKNVQTTMRYVKPNMEQAAAKIAKVG